MSVAETDLAILGGGPGGYITALRAAHQGLRVTVVEQAGLGGACLNTGCIPTKAMVASVALLRQARAAAAMGIHVAADAAVLPAMIQRRRDVVAKLGQGVQALLQKNRVTVVKGRGRLQSSRVVEVQGAGAPTCLQAARAIIIATGSRPKELPVAPRDGRVILNSDDLLELDTPPGELIIAGGGYIGCEFASLFAGLGSRVSVIEMMDHLLPGLDRDLGLALARSFRHAGIEVKLQQRITGTVVEGSRVRVTLADGHTLSGDRLLVAVGRTPNSGDLGLETAGVQLEHHAIRVDDHMETTAPGVYAIGDVTGQLALAHVAAAQGRVVVDNLLAGRHASRMDYHQVPAVVFTHPEIATVGLSEEEAKARSLSVRVARFPFAGIGKAVASGEADGFVKLVACADSGALLGGHIAGASAGELIGQLALALKLGAKARDLTDTIVAHPTLGEAVMEAAEGLFGQSTHSVKR